MAACIVYLLGVVVLLGFWQVQPTHNAISALTNIFAPYLLAPLLLIVPLAALLRQKLLLIGSVAVLLAGGGMLLPDAFPDQTRSTARPTLRIISYNKLFYNGDPEGTMAALLAQQADIIALQELDARFIETLSQHRERYPHQELIPPEGFPGGVGIISRHPIESTRYLPTIRAVEAIVNIDGTQVSVWSVHTTLPRVELHPVDGTLLPRPVFDTTLRDQQIGRLAETVYQIDLPLILAGDFNTGAREPILHELSAGLQDSFGATGWGWGHTFPNYPDSDWRDYLVPRVRIDYIWLSSALVPVHTRVNCTVDASDHCMLIADVGWR